MARPRRDPRLALTDRALQRGVIQGYVTREDIAENRILRAALTRMQSVPRLTRAMQRRLGHLAARLGGARHLVPGAPLPPWRPTRLNASYQPALRMSELILRGLGVGTTDGGRPVGSFVVDMAAVFESFITTALSAALATASPGGVTHPQYRDVLDVDARIPIRPDIVHAVAGTAVAVVDAKYKLATDSGGYPPPTSTRCSPTAPHSGSAQAIWSTPGLGGPAPSLSGTGSVAPRSPW